MIELNYEFVDGSYVVSSDCRVGVAGSKQYLLIYDVTLQPAGRYCCPLNYGAEAAVCEEGHDYHGVVEYPGSDCRYTSISFSIRNGELIELQDEDFAKAVELVTSLRKEGYRNFNVMRLSRWDMERALELVMDNED